MACCSKGKQVVTLPLPGDPCGHISVPAGPSHMSLYVRPRAGSALSRWSLGDGVPVASLGGDYFVFYSRGLHAAPWHFWVELTVSAALLETGDALVHPLPAMAAFLCEKCYCNFLMLCFIS